MKALSLHQTVGLVVVYAFDFISLESHKNGISSASLLSPPSIQSKVKDYPKSDILRDVCIYVSQRLWHRRNELYDIATKLGGAYAWKFESKCTHFIHSGNRQNESFKEFKTAVQKGIPMVSPWWLYKVCLSSMVLCSDDKHVVFGIGTAASRSRFPFLLWQGCGGGEIANAIQVQGSRWIPFQ